MPARSPSDEEYDSPSPPPPTRRHRNASKNTINKTGSGGSLISNVLSFVSREIGDFVATATGGAEASTTQPVAGPSRERGGGAPRTDKRHRRQSAPSQPQHEVRASKRARREREASPPPARSPREYVMDVVDHDTRGRAAQRGRLSPSPSRRRRSTSITMPGSLFSRSPTPDHAPPTDADERRVRFAPDIVSPAPRQPYRTARRAPAPEPEAEEEQDDKTSQSQSDEDYDGDFSSSPERPEGSIYPPLPSPPRRMAFPVAGSSSHAPPASPFRAPAIGSVKDAIAKFDGDSPPRVARPATPSRSVKGKGRAQDLPPQVPWPSVNKGKGKELSRPRLDPALRLPSTVGSIEGARRVDAFLRRGASDTDDGVEDPGGTRLTPEDEPDEPDKRRIRELEEKVKSLEHELARRPPPHRDSAPPPPPPPPPPPLPMDPTSRIPLSSPRRGPGVNNVLASVRAGLKQTPNAPETAKAVPKNRLPTVPADKMEAFLSELKTVRLRKVGSGDSLSRETSTSGLSGWSGRDHSQSSSQGSSLTEDRSTVGYKRKRVESGNEAQSALVTSIKRRFNVPSQSSTVSSSYSVAGPSSIPSRSFLPPPHPSTITHLRNCNPTHPMAPEVDGTTPSLCSDNDNELEDRGPSTPPLAPAVPAPDHLLPPHHEAQLDSVPVIPARHPHVEVRAPRERHQERDLGGLHTQERRAKAPPRPQAQSSATSQSLSSTTGRSATPARQMPRHSEAPDDPFSRRPPSSPLLPETPRRPRPPARVRTESKPPSRPPRSRSPSLPDSDDDPLSMSFSPPDDESTPAPDPVGRQRQGHRQTARKERRLTLEDEIRKVDSSYSEEERAVNELESGVLVGVGQKSKQLGFLARGGAGGEPVLMGVGYVEGALDESQAKEVEAVKEKKRGKSSTGGKRKPKR